MTRKFNYSLSDDEDDDDKSTASSPSDLEKKQNASYQEIQQEYARETWGLFNQMRLGAAISALSTNSQTFPLSLFNHGEIEHLKKNHTIAFSQQIKNNEQKEVIRDILIKTHIQDHTSFNDVCDSKIDLIQKANLIIQREINLNNILTANTLSRRDTATSVIHPCREPYPDSELNYSPLSTPTFRNLVLRSRPFYSTNIPYKPANQHDPWHPSSPFMVMQELFRNPLFRQMFSNNSSQDPHPLNDLQPIQIDLSSGYSLPIFRSKQSGLLWVICWHATPNAGIATASYRNKSNQLQLDEYGNIQQGDRTIPVVGLEQRPGGSPLIFGSGYYGAIESCRALGFSGGLFHDACHQQHVGVGAIFLAAFCLGTRPYIVFSDATDHQLRQAPNNSEVARVIIPFGGQREINHYEFVTPWGAPPILLLQITVPQPKSRFEL